MDNVIEGVGITSSILISIMFIPQIIHVYIAKDTRAINYSFLAINLIASTLGLIYSVYLVIIPMIIANVSAGFFSMSLLIMKYTNNSTHNAFDVVTSNV